MRFVSSHLLQIFRFATVKLKTMLLDFLYLGHSLLKHMVRKLKAFNYSNYLINLIVDVILDYFNKTVYNPFTITTNLRGGVL